MKYAELREVFKELEKFSACLNLAARVPTFTHAPETNEEIRAESIRQAVTWIYEVRARRLTKLGVKDLPPLVWKDDV